MYLIVGLGNPGDKYVNNRHNVGFKFIDEINDSISYSKKFQSEFAQSNIGNEKVLLLKPQTYMNLSGHAVRECANFFKVKPEDIIVVHDDVDLEFGKIRVKLGGGAGGHNGLKSIDSQIGNGYKRLRFGVGKGKNAGDTAKYVLSDFSKYEQVILPEILYSLASNVKMLLEGKDSEFMNKVTLETRAKINKEIE